MTAVRRGPFARRDVDRSRGARRSPEAVRWYALDSLGEMLGLVEYPCAMASDALFLGDFVPFHLTALRERRLYRWSFCGRASAEARASASASRSLSSSPMRT